MNNIFGENLKRIREEKGVSQRELARKISISIPNISRWENGKAYPQVIWVYRIAEVLKITPEELVGLHNT